MDDGADDDAAIDDDDADDDSGFVLFVPSPTSHDNKGKVLDHAVNWGLAGHQGDILSMCPALSFSADTWIIWLK